MELSSILITALLILGTLVLFAIGFGIIAIIYIAIKTLKEM